MEIEVKYALPSKETIDEILKDELIEKLSEGEDLETVPLRAIYYDTADGSLGRNRISLRVRSEGPVAFATMKWDGSVNGAVHSRQEVNVPVPIEDASFPPEAELFAQTPKYDELKSLTERSPLVPVLTMQFTRSRKRIRYDRNVMEMALDCGNIVTPYGSCPILEMELEHYAGSDPTSVIELGEIIADKYGLELEPRSKYSRGLKLINQARKK